MADYIDRNELVGNLDRFAHEHLTPLLRSLIEKQPTADVMEVKHGKWIKRGNEKKCSVCDFIYYSNNDDWNGCPNCLSKMDGKDTNVPTK